MKTSDKGDIGSITAMADLSKKGYSILTPLSESLPFDFVAYKDGKFLRFQAKYNAKGLLKNQRVMFAEGKYQVRPYADDEFDYYALYLPQADKVVYPSIKFKGCTIRTDLPQSSTPFYWYEDFLRLTDVAKKRKSTEFKDYKPQGYKPRPKGRKVERPTADELRSLLWKEPTTKIAAQYGVSDKAVDKWAKTYGLEKPKRGYWSGERQ